MQASYPKNLAIHVEKQGSTRVPKARFPLRHGRYSELRTSEYEFIFNLNGEIKFIRGLNPTWPHPAEQLKRTDGNDWVYYSVGDKSGKDKIVSWMAEYYLPCLPYPSNAIWEIDYTSNPAIMSSFAAWSQLVADLHGSGREQRNAKSTALIDLILKHHDGVLHERSQRLKEVIGGRISVLPPDTRHADYEIVPLMISDGCLYHCDFCCVQSDTIFQPRSKADISEQIKRLKEFYGRNLENYSSLFLGNHDALGAGEDLILYAASEACRAFGFKKPQGPMPLLYLFGSIHSFLRAGNRLFEKLDQLPFYTYINIGLESVDTPTLQQLGKPVDESKVRAAFKKMLEVNGGVTNVEVTVNFVIGKGLSHDHYQSLKALLRGAPVASPRKGMIYLSPLKDSPKKRELLPLVHEIQNQSRLPVSVYLIQRL